MEQTEPVYFTDDDVQRLIPVSDAIKALETAFTDEAVGTAWSNPRQRLRTPRATLHLMAAYTPGYFGYKAYTSSRGKTRFQFFLFSAETADLLAVFDADALGRIRTGAATGLATRLLSLENASEAVLFGAGGQAETQLLGMLAARDLKRVWIVNRSVSRRDAFIERMQPRVKAELLFPPDIPAAVASSQIVTTITTSREPVLKGEWLVPGQHINAAGANMLVRRELDDAAVLRADLIAVDSLEQARIEAGEFTGVIETGRRHWSQFAELREVAAGKRGRTTRQQITLFKSLGTALEDVAVAKLAFEGL